MTWAGQVHHGGGGLREVPAVMIPARSGAGPEGPEAEAKRAEALRQKYAGQARGLVARAESEAAELRAKAEATAERIVETARVDSDAARAAAHAEVDAIREKARDEGWDAGFGKGLEEARVGTRATLDRLDGVVGEAKRLRREALVSAEEGGIQVVMAALRVLLRRSGEEDRDLVARLLSEAARTVSATEKITIRVAPIDLSSAEAFRPTLLTMIEGLRECRVVADPTVSAGGCLIDTEFGRVDARLETRLAEIERTLRRARMESGLASVTAPTESAPAVGS